MPQKINERPFTGKCSWGIKGSSSCGQMNNVWLPIPTVLVHNIFRAHWENLTKSGANIHLDSKKVTLTSHRFVVSSVVVKMISQVTLKEILCLQVWHERLLGLKNVSRSHKAIDRIENYKNVKGGGGVVTFYIQKVKDLHICMLKVWKIIKKLLALTQHCISEVFTMWVHLNGSMTFWQGHTTEKQQLQMQISLAVIGNPKLRPMGVLSETFFITWILHLTNVISSGDSSCTPLISPCSRPMRKRASVIERIGWEQKWARIGVKAVIEPQAAADSRRTFSPPTLWTEHRWVALALTLAY